MSVMKTRFSPWAACLMVAVAVVVMGCSPSDPDNVPRGVVVTPDPQPAIDLSLDEPFELMFGRGSGWHGLDVVQISPDGSVEVTRATQALRDDVIELTFEVAQLQLSPEAMRKVLERVDGGGLMAMDAMYIDERMADGTQWVFWCRQGEHEKVIYFSNHFPGQIEQFAGSLDSELEEAGLSATTWRASDEVAYRARNAQLWAKMDRLRKSQIQQP